jgi:hypothetical protein
MLNVLCKTVSILVLSFMSMTVSAEDNMDLEKILMEFERLMKNLNPALVQDFRPGLNEAELQEAAKAFAPMPLPKDLATLYGWHNGSKGWITPSFTAFPSLQEIAESYKAMPEEQEFWNPLWIPLCRSDGGEMVFIAGGSKQGEIYDSSYEGGILVLMNRSLSSYFQVLTRAYREGVFYRNEAGQWRINHHAFLALCRQIEPGVYGDADRLRPQNEGITYFDMYASRLWPEDWQRAIGREPKDYQPQGRTMTIAELAHKAKPGRRERIHAEIGRRIVTDVGVFYSLRDESGETYVFSPPDFTYEREIYPLGNVHEIEIEVMKEPIRTITGNNRELIATPISWTKTLFLRESNKNRESRFIQKLIMGLLSILEKLFR